MAVQLLVFTLLFSFFLVLFFAPLTIPFLRKLKFGQSIRSDGPSGHHKKSGTPTMGGIIILGSMIVVTLIMMSKLPNEANHFKLLLFSTFGFGLIGFIDDFIKVVLKRNLGLTVIQKLIGQIIVSFSIYSYMIHIGHGTTIFFPLLNITIDLGWIYLIYIMLYYIFMTNAVNLTDGLDGLLSGTAVISFGALTVIAWNQQNIAVTLFSIAAIGSLVGFLFFNAYPARIFMGDTGSIGLGGALVTSAFILNSDVLFAIIGGIFIIEAVSVILQVISFKLTKKRIFKMSPLHHHYELCGWSEWKIVTTFWAIGLILSAVGIYIEVWL